ncbi:hypothetical protein CNR22_15690 [Sphingobacteriaceae bacterium]|nr:hypothetical protein CNR22_15690 [Sphingobacteriaceae bacterium]
MKRILYSCFILLSLCLTNKVNAQTPYFEIPNNAQCANSSGTYAAVAQIGLNVPLATNYIWTVTGANCTPTFVAIAGTSVAPWGNVTNTAIAIVLPCCGLFTVTCVAQLPSSGATAVNQNSFTSQGYSTGVIFCPTGAGITPSVQTICLGNSATITPSGAATYTWSNGASNFSITTGAIVISPSVNTAYTFTGTTASGCTITPAQAATVNVQAITSTVSPASQSMCAGSPVCFTAAATALGSPNNAPGTIITSFDWFGPSGSVGNGPTTCTIAPPVNSIFSVVVTYTGAAGTCTQGGTSAVVITTNIPVSITPTNPSACPNSIITLTAVSIQTTTSTNFTWTTWDGTGTPTINTSFHDNPHQVIIGNFPSGPMLGTVVVNYFGCPGTATFAIVQRTLTPTLVSSAPLSCPGQSLTLSASGGLTYTFTGFPFGASTATTIGTATGAPNATVNTVHTPTPGSFPIQYCVNAYSAGCTGTTCIIVNTKILTPILTASSPSICPNTEVTLTPSGSGVASGSTFTYATATNSNIGTNYPQLYTNTAPLNSTQFHTYSVTVDSAGCTGVGTVTVHLLTLRTDLSSTTPSICPGRPLTLNSTGGAGTTYTFFASTPQFNSLPTSTVVDAGTTNTVIHTPPSNSFVMTYTVQTDSVGCKGNDTYTVGILDLGPTLTLTPYPSASVCPGSTVTINAVGSTNYTFVAPSTGPFFAWDGITNGTDNSDTIKGTANVPTVIPVSGLNYTVQADSAGCVGSTTITIFERKLQPTIVASPTLVCSGKPVAISAGNVGTQPAPNLTTYTFIALAGNTPSVLSQPSSPSFSVPDSPTVQTVYSVLVDSMGCTGVFPPPSVTVDIRPDLALLPSSSAVAVCPGLSATLSVVTPTAAPPYTYTWTQTSGSGSVTSSQTNSINLTVNPTSNSTYSIHVLDSLGCVGNSVISVGIDPSLHFSVSLASTGGTICSPQSVTITASNTVQANSIGAINYTWTPNSFITPTIGPVVTASPNINTTYTVLADNGFGCTGQNTITVVVGTYPSTVNPIVATAASVCIGFTSTLTAFGAASYTWTGSSFTNGIAQQSIAAVPNATYMVLMSNGGGCTATAFYTVGLLPNLTPSIIAAPASQTTCITSNNPKFSKPVHLTASGAGTYVWVPYNPSYMTYSLGSQTDVRPPASTQYTLIGSTAICSGTAVININVIPQFSINVIPPLPAMCQGDSLKLSIVNIGAGAVGPVSAYTYSWTEALNAPPLSLSDYFTSTVTVYPQNTTTYTTEVRDSRECISLPRLVTVTVLPQPLTAIAIPTINNVPTNTVCFVGLNPGASDVTINLTGNNLNTGLQFGVVPTYTWVSPYGSTYNSILSPANNNAVTVNAPIRLLNGSSIATYTLISGYNGVQGCKRFDTVSIRVIDCRPIRNVKFRTAELNDTICARSCITFMSLTDTMAGGPQNYNWQFEGGSPNTSTLTNPTVCYNFPNPGRPYSVILKVSNPYPLIDPNGGPGGSALTFGQNMIKVVDIPNVTVIAPGQVQSDTIVRFGSSVKLNGTGAHTYEWSPPYNITSLTNPSVTVNPFKTTQYILKGYNSKSCYSSDTINVLVVEDCGEMYVPNAFTPNNDGVNDVLYVRGICLQSLTFMVFNRFGEKVFETADQSVGWDGTFKGQEINTSVFVYRLEGKTYDGKGFSAKGNITLLR